MSEQVEQERCAPSGVALNEIDMMTLCARAGQVAASEAALYMGPQGLVDGFDPMLWASGGFAHAFEGDDSGEAAVLSLAQCAAVPEEVSGNMLFIHAALKGIHDFPLDSYNRQPLWLRVAYCAFSSQVRLIFGMYREALELAAIADADARPHTSAQIDLEESIFELMAGAGERDDTDVALYAGLVPEAPPTPVEEKKPEKPAMSVGERPVKHKK